MDTCVVLPLAKGHAANMATSERLNPRFEIEGAPVVQLTQLVGVVPMRALRKYVTNIEAHRNTIVRALDFLFEGI
jgi:hypothetical protein